MNNYNMSSTGLNIEADVFFDTVIGQSNFDENMKRVLTPDEYIFTDNGNMSGEYDESIDYLRVKIKGYCQGDFATVLIDLDEFEAVTGVTFDDKIYKEYFVNLFWDAPLCCRAVINGEEYISEKFDGQYKPFEKWLFIAEILEAFPALDQDVLKRELDAILPNTPEQK